MFRFKTRTVVPVARAFVCAFLFALFGLACLPTRVALPAEVCEIAVRDVRKSREVKRVRDRAQIDRVLAVLRAEREERSPSEYGHTLPAGRFNLLFYSCRGPVDQLAIGMDFISDYHENRVYALSPAERAQLRDLLKIRF